MQRQLEFLEESGILTKDQSYTQAKILVDHAFNKKDNIDLSLSIFNSQDSSPVRPKQRKFDHERFQKY